MQGSARIFDRENAAGTTEIEVETESFFELALSNSGGFGSELARLP